MLRRKLILKRIGKVFLITFVLLVILHTSLLIIWKHQLDSALSEIRSHGEPVSAADLLSKRIPDAENAAIPYRQAADLSGKITMSDHKGSMALYELAASQSDDPTSEVTPQVRDMLKRCQRIFVLIDEGQLRHKASFIGKNPEPMMPGFPLSSGASCIRELCRKLQCRAIVEAADGKMDAVVDDLIRTIRLGDAAVCRPMDTLNGAVLQWECVKWALTTMNRIARHHNFTPKQVRRVYDELSRIDFTPGFVAGLNGDRVEYNSYFDAARKDLTSYLQATSWGVSSYRFAPFARTVKLPATAPAKEPGRFTRFTDSIVSYIWRPFSYKDQLIYVGLLTDSLKVSNMSYKDGYKLLRAKYSKPQLYIRLTKFPGYSPFTGAWRLRDKAVADAGMGQAAMALLAFKSRFGVYPHSLAEAQSKIGWKIPNDPFSGKPFVYKPTSNGFKLYSIGWDLKDNGGKNIEKHRPWRGDIVWNW